MDAILSMLSIIIPAHNEAQLISLTLSSLISFIDQCALQIIVVCNGCTDETAKIVRTLDDRLLCIETPIASKTHALNLGDAAATFYPRIYMDADVLLPFESVKSMYECLTADCLAVAPEVKMDFSDCSLFVKAYYNIWLQLPYCQAGMIGTGVYALSEVGRKRFGEFPSVIADDGFVRCLFNESERGVAKGVYSIVKAPKDLWSLIKIKTRSRLGRYELEEKYPDLILNEQKQYGSAVVSILKRIDLWPHLVVYLLVNLFSRWRAKRQMQQQFRGWERDESNRI